MTRKEIGISIILAGFPIIYFLRDGLQLSPGNFYFTGFFMFISLSLLLNFRILNFRIAKPNLLLLYPASIFLICSFIYFLFSNYDDKMKDLFYFGYLMIYFFLLLNVKKEEVNKIHLSFLFLTLINAFLFIFYLKIFFTEFREIGSRAYIGLEEGNPNIYAFIAYYGIVASYLVLKDSFNMMINVIAIFNLLLNVLVIILTQNRTVLIALLSLLLIILTRRTFNVMYHMKMKKIKLSRLIYMLGILSLFVVILVNIVQVDVIKIYLENYTNYILGLFANLSGGSGDMSSIQRIDSFKLILSELNSNPENYLLGKGYKDIWLDIPVLQALRDLGIIGGTPLLLFHIFAIYYIFKYLKSKSPNPMYNFLSAMYLLIFLNYFSHGQPYDLSFWLPLATFIRFFKLENTINFYKSKRNYSSGVTYANS